MIAVLTVSIAVAFAAVTFLPAMDEAHGPLPGTNVRPAAGNGVSATGVPAVVSTSSSAPAASLPTSASRWDDGRSAETDAAPEPVVAAASTVPPEPGPSTSSGPSTSGPSTSSGPSLSAPPSLSPPPSTASERAAGDLASYYTALAAGDLIGAFDHLTADVQAQVGGYDAFATLWGAIVDLQNDSVRCSEKGQRVACESLLEVVGVDGSCTRSEARTELALVGSRYRIVEQSIEPAVACPA